MKQHVVRVVAHWALLTHIYVSMAGLTLAVLFGATGLALNHQGFGLGDPKTSTSKITLDKHLVDNPDQAALEQILRRQLGIRSPSTDYHDDTECRAAGAGSVRARPGPDCRQGACPE